MARKNTNEELWLEVSAAGVYRDLTAGATGTIDTQAAAAQSDVVLGTGEGSSFSTGDIIRIGGGNVAEWAEVESIATDTLTLVSLLAFTHEVGEAVVEQESVDLGAVSEDGITRETTVERTEIRAATQASAYANLTTSVGQRLTWNLLNHSLENVMICLGLDEANIHGAGSAADPDVADLIADDMGGLANHALWFTGALNDGSDFEIQGWAAEFDPNQTLTYLRGQAVLLPIAADIQHIRYITPLT
jgi:hypothetical protein